MNRHLREFPFWRWKACLIRIFWPRLTQMRRSHRQRYTTLWTLSGAFSLSDWLTTLTWFYASLSLVILISLWLADIDSGPYQEPSRVHASDHQNALSIRDAAIRSQGRVRQDHLRHEEPPGCRGLILQSFQSPGGVFRQLKKNSYIVSNWQKWDLILNNFEAIHWRIHSRTIWSVFWCLSGGCLWVLHPLHPARAGILDQEDGPQHPLHHLRGHEERPSLGDQEDGGLPGQDTDTGAGGDPGRASVFQKHEEQQSCQQGWVRPKIKP